MKINVNYIKSEEQLERCGNQFFTEQEVEEIK